MTRKNSTHFTTQISFPRRDNPALATEKPYVLDYFPGRGICRTNIEFEVVRNIEVQDLRESSLSFEKNGVGVTQLMTAMEYPDFQDVEKVESCYLQEARDAISGCLGADDVYVIDYNIRRRDATFPSATGSSYDAAQPVVVAHGDYTPRDAYERIKILFGEEAEAKAKQRFQIVNLWKPLRGPVRDWPLAICDPLTIDPQRDVLLVDAVFRDSIGEGFNLHHHPDQRWYYLSNQTSCEALIFNGYDSRFKTMCGVPHCAVEYTLPDRDTIPRESVEVRAIAFFKDD